MRAYRDTLAKLLQIAGNYELSWMQAGADDPVVPGLWAKLDVDDVHSVIWTDGIHLLNALHFLDR